MAIENVVDQMEHEHSSVARPRSMFVSRIWRQMVEDDCFDLAAQISFYFSLSLLPFCLVLAVLVGRLPSTLLWNSFATWIVTYLPSDSRQIILSTILGLGTYSVRFFSLGLITAVWGASAGFVSLMESMSVICNCKETRSYFKKHVIGVGAAFVSMFFALTCFGLVAFGHWGYVWFSADLGGARFSSTIWELGRWTLTLVVLCLAIDLANFALPDGKRRWKWITPGTAFVLVMLTMSTACFNLYFKHFSVYPRLYGALGGFIILMLWIYIASLIVLVGAETDCQLSALARETATANQA